MKISTNSVGNYARALTVPAGDTGVPLKKNNSVPEEKKIINDAAVNEAEKKFFARLYPGNEPEIMNYHFYQNNGRLSGVRIGTLLDRRG